MNRLILLCLFLPMLPILGGFFHRAGIWVGAVLGSGGLLAAAFVSDSNLNLIFLAQIPMIVATSFATNYLLNGGTFSNKKINSEKDSESLALVRERHQSLKESIGRQEQEEARSLQIYGVAKGLAESLSWKEMSPRLASGLQKLFGAYEFLLYAIDSHGTWSLLERRGHWVKEPPLSSVPSAVSLVHPPQVQELVPVLFIPIYSGQEGQAQATGVLFLKSSDQAKSEAELLATGQEFGEQLGVALSKALLFSQMEMHSRVDGLTGVFRRQPFMDRLNEELKRARVFRTPFCLMMVDIDHFKSINDTHGHPAGDAVLRRVGQILKESVYETDVVGRYGGEEFIILLPRADVAGVLRKAEALRKRFETEIIPSGFENLRITVSIGVSRFPESGQEAESLIAAADHALYEAKETGRNRVVAA